MVQHAPQERLDILASVIPPRLAFEPIVNPSFVPQARELCGRHFQECRSFPGRGKHLAGEQDIELRHEGGGYDDGRIRSVHGDFPSCRRTCAQV